MDCGVVHHDPGGTGDPRHLGPQAIILSVGVYVLKLDIDTLRTMTMVTLALNGQAVFYVVRERKRLWSSRPSAIVIASTVANFVIIGTMAIAGILMAPLALSIIGGLFAAAVVLAIVMDQVKVWLFGWLKMA